MYMHFTHGSVDYRSECYMTTCNCRVHPNIYGSKGTTYSPLICKAAFDWRAFIDDVVHVFVCVCARSRLPHFL